MWATLNPLILAQQEFFDSSLGKFVGNLLAAVAVLVVLAALVKGVGAATKGKMGEAVKSVIGGAAIAAFLFNPTLISDLISVFSTIVTKVIESITQIGGN